MIGSYLLGCAATGYYLVRWRTGQDLRTLGSGSVGARNAGRVLGTWGFLLTLLGDLSKGMMALGLAAVACPGDAAASAIAMVAVVAGHLWPLQLGFRGGKGVATALGALVLADWRLAAGWAVLLLLMLPWTRSSVLAAMIAFAGIPAAAFPLHHGSALAYGATLACGMVLWAHRTNVASELSRRIAGKSREAGIQEGSHERAGVQGSD